MVCDLLDTFLITPTSACVMRLLPVHYFSVTSRSFGPSRPLSPHLFPLDQLPQLSSTSLLLHPSLLLSLLLSSWPCYTAQRINCGLKNSQLTLGGTVEVDGSELQGERMKAWTPFRCCSTPLILPRRPEGTPLWHLPPRTGSLFALVGELLIFQACAALHLAHVNTLPILRYPPWCF